MEVSYEFLFLLFVLMLGILALIAFIINVWIPYQRERKYIKMEMKRSDGEEYYYWKRQLKRLYISHIPIVGRFIR